MFIESLGVITAPVMVKGAAVGLPAAKSALVAQNAAAAMANFLIRGSVAAKIWLAAHHAATGSAPGAAVVLPGVAMYGTGATRSLGALLSASVPPVGISVPQIANPIATVIQNGSLVLTDLSTTTSGIVTPIQNTISAAQSIVTSVQDLLLPLTAGAAGGGAAQVGLSHRQQKQNEGRLGELLSRLTAQEETTTWLQEQITTATSWIDQFQASTATAPPPAAPLSGDALEEIKGIGTVFARRLNQAGIFTFADLAALTPAEIQAIVAPGRAAHMFDLEDWITQARQRMEAAGKEF